MNCADISKEQIPTFLQDLEREQFFGKVIVEYNRGVPFLVRVEITKKIRENIRNERNTRN